MMYYYYYSPVVFRSQLYFSLCTMSIFLFLLVLSLLIPTHNAQDYYSDIYKHCSQSVTSACGTTIEGKVEYPFWVENIQPLHCGLDEFKLSCDEDNIVVDLGLDSKYRVVAIHPQTTMLVLEHYKDPPVDHICESSSVSSTILNTSLYYYGQNTTELLLFYNCSNEIDTSSSIEHIYQLCQSNNKNQVYFYEKTLSQAQGDKFGLCSNATLLVNTSVLENFMKNPVKPEQLFQGSFEVQYYSTNQKACAHCVETGGLCWHGTSSKDKNTCLHSDGTLIPLSPGKKTNAGVITAAVVGSIGVGMFLLLIFLVLYRRRKLKRGSSAVSQNVSSYSFSMSDSEKGGGTYMGVPIFSYNELEKATNNFDSGNELGDGGFGTVYKGKLQDGREVAVKRLYENSFKRVEQFMNEIAILAKLRHPNLVVLYGSTSHECRKLLLVYEYIPNGTIADHLYEEDAKPGNLTWKTRMSIAVETSSALLYLHLSEVIHRDVKTTNILLDDNFHVKVADFGLSRLFPQNFTHVSTAPQGTPGYVDPEYHQCYQLTTKSDVYSFGVVLIELISSKPAVDITRHRHEINLANLAINKIQGDALHELVDPSLGFESDYEIRNMISEVAELAFRCLQNDRESRPSMDEVHISLKEIQNRYYGEKNELTDNVFRDDALLLKNHPPNRSPDSVTVNWVSTSTNSSSSRKVIVSHV